MDGTEDLTIPFTNKSPIDNIRQYSGERTCNDRIMG